MTRRLLPFAAAALSVLAVTAGSVQAKTHPQAKAKTHKITGTSATLTPSSSSVKFLTTNKVGFTVLSPASASGGAIMFPVTGGRVTNKLVGTVRLGGGIKFTVDKKGYAFRRLTVVSTAHKAFLDAVLNGKRVVPLARLSGVALSVKGTTATVTGELKLTSAYAQVINKALGRHALKAGADLGSFSATITFS